MVDESSDILFQVEVLKSLNINLEFLSSETSHNRDVITSGQLRGSFNMANLGVLEEDDKYEYEDDSESDGDKSVEAQKRKIEIQKSKVEFQKWLKEFSVHQTSFSLVKIS